MAVTKALEDIISEQSSIVCEQIEAAVSFADSEEDLRIEVEKAIEVFRKEADLPELKGHHEVTIGKGRADSVYDYVSSSTKNPVGLRNPTIRREIAKSSSSFRIEPKHSSQN